MTHLEVENLTSEYLEGLLEAELKRDFEAHLNDCPSCVEMLEDVRRVMEMCHAAPELDPAPWLVSKIMAATVGQHKPGLLERWLGFLRPTLQPRIAYTVAMAVFSLSVIMNAAGINLRHLTVEDLNPRTWIFRGNRAGHLFVARAEKFYYDLRVVIEIESRLRQLRSRPQEEPESPKQEPTPGGSTNTAPPAFPALASNQVRMMDPAEPGAALRSEIAPPPLTLEAVRSRNP